MDKDKLIYKIKEELKERKETLGKIVFFPISKEYVLGYIAGRERNTDHFLNIKDCEEIIKEICKEESE